jgi:uncharacterized protein YdeI (YjbR/CyaY-like superfamily)
MRYQQILPTPPPRSGGVDCGRDVQEANDTEVLDCADAAVWEAWLAGHPESSGIWLRIARKGSDHVSVTISDALDVALCYGWIDSQRKGHDADHYLQRYSPRRPRSPWSRLNVVRVESLIAAGRMHERGLAEVAAAEADGRWAAAYVPQRDVSLPPDFAAALAENERATRAFEHLGKSARYAIILRILKATTSAARVRRIEEAIARLHA